MSLEILQGNEQIAIARAELDRRGLSALSSPFQRKVAELRSRFHLGRPLVLGDYVKSWDVLRTIEFLESRVTKADPILDIGAYASEVLISLHRAGFKDLTGADLNPKLPTMPLAEEIRYVVTDFMHTPFPDASFAAVTSISVIEHGYDPQRLFAEVSRILKPGGFFLASTDYWQTKLASSHLSLFNMSWTIFSETELRELVDIAGSYGLDLVGEWHAASGERAISHAGQDYTFAWLALQKRP